jgi:esterase/lipase superfamily enzyme
MSRQFRIDRNSSLAELVDILRHQEALLSRLTGLEIDPAATIATFAANVERLAPLDLVLGPAPAGTETVCRGKAYISGEARVVTAYRREAPARKVRDRPERPDPLPKVRERPRANAAPKPGTRGIVADRGRPAGASASAGGPRAPARAGASGGFRDGLAWPAAPKAKKAARPPARKAAPKATKAARPPARKAAPKRAAAPAELKPGEYRVWFGTNRKPVDAADPSKGFLGERGDRTHYGHCDVYVPRSHKMGSIGSSAAIRWVTGTDDRLKLRRLAGLDPEDFWTGVREQLKAAAPGKRDAVVFIHGYRVSFRDAAVRAAQIGFDLGIEGAMGLFSWPSKGTLLGYFADGSAIEDSEEAIADFLVDFARRSGAEAVHVIAHSMGNRGLLRAAKCIVADAKRRSGCRFGQFILAAPDVDAGLFLKLADAYKALARRTTLYASSKDLAVHLSRWIHDYSRIGFHPPISVFDGVDTVSVSNVDLTLLGHGYVGEAREVLHDMERLIATDQPPPRFGQEEQKTPDGHLYWQIRG